MEEITEESTKAIVRDSQGRFVEGNKEGRKFRRGYAGKPKGAKNKKTLVAREFAEDVLFLNPDTGKQMSYKELCIYISKKADQSPRILNLLLDHCLGKPVERHEHKQHGRVIIHISPSPPKEVKPAEEEGTIIDGQEINMLEKAEE
jgi:hypothetical protein